MELGAAAIIKFIAALVFVLALMGGLALALKKLGIGHASPGGRAGRRLKLVEVMPIDARRKAAIIACDGEEHLVILGPSGDTVIETSITKRTVSHEASLKNVA